MKAIPFFFLFFCLAQMTAQTKSATVSHTAWSALLAKHVKNGGVNYAGFKTDAKAFDTYLLTLKSAKPGTQTKEDLAFWINAYNAFTIKLVVDNYPVKSIKDINGGEPWKKSWIQIGETTYSLDAIENTILRTKFKEPRIHFAINCAAKSCPPLRAEAFTAAKMEAQLSEQTTAFINNPKFNTISAKALKLSNIFDWFKADFGDVAVFIKKYYTGKTPPNTNVSIKYTTYDWALNQ
jgi:Protein of unknown function, DUF547